MTKKRVLIEEEQRARVRAAALKLEAVLLSREGEEGVAEQLTDVRTTLVRVGRNAPLTETLTIRAHAERLRRQA